MMKVMKKKKGCERQQSCSAEERTQNGVFRMDEQTWTNFTPASFSSSSFSPLPSSTSSSSSRAAAACLPLFPPEEERKKSTGVEENVALEMFYTLNSFNSQLPPPLPPSLGSSRAHSLAKPDK